jgi:ATP-dependent DNA helicase RecG
MEAGQRKDLRELIFREVVGNLIVHLEYTDARSSDLIITKNEVLMTNPNKPLFHGPLDPNCFTPYPKNPNIRKFFTAFGWTDEIGSGVRNTTKYLAFYVPGAEPLFLENDLFRTQIPLVFATLSRFSDFILNWLELPDDLKTHLETGLNKIQLDPDLESTDWEGLVLHLVPSWHEKGTKLRELRWPKKQALTADGIKKVPSWNEKGAKLLHKKIYYLITIMILCSNPIRIDEMMKYLQYKKRQSFREIYLIPLQQVGFITMTIPDKPNDPNQKYVITEKGKLFLAGRDL